MFKFKTEPLPHQHEQFNLFKDKQLFALNADMGTGKTKTLIDLTTYKYTLKELDRVLVIAPSGVHAQWLDEQYPEHCSEPYDYHIYTAKKTLGYIRSQDSFLWNARTTEKLQILSMNVEAFARINGVLLAKQFLATNKTGCAIIIDEASIIKTPDIQTTRNIKLLRTDYPKAFRNTMTGTPAAKNPSDMWSIYDFLQENYMGCSYIAFKMIHTVVYRKKIRIKKRLITVSEDIKEELYYKVKKLINIEMDKHDGDLDYYFIEDMRAKFGLSINNFWHIANSKYFSKYKNLDRLYNKIKPITYMIKKSECLKLPPKIYKKQYFELNTHQKQLIKQLQTYSLAMYQGKELTLEIKQLLGLRVLQICGGFFAHHTDIEGTYDVYPIKGKNAKLEFIRHDLAEVGSQQGIIWSVYTAEINLIYNTLLRDNESVGRLDGTVVGDDRIKVVRQFKAGELQHLVAHPAVGGYGYNFQNAGIQYWYSRNYRTEHRIQAEDRNYRIGTTESPIYKDLLYDIMWENKVYNQMQDEKALNEMFISGKFEDIFKIKGLRK